jgi:predicted MFS family arabinose efflux permease
MSAGNERRSRLPIFVLKHRDYRLLWFGQMVSTLGTQMHTVALSWQIYDMTGSVVQLGMLGLVRAIALMGTSLIGGAAADSHNRRSLMLVTQSLMLALTLGLAACTALDIANIWVLYAFAATTAATSAFDGPARQALIPSLVPRHDLGPAISLNMLAMSSARMVGPAIGGISVGLVGIAATYVIDAMSFVAVIVALLLMRTKFSAPVLAVRGMEAIKEGLRFIVATPVIWGIMLMDFLATLLGSSVGLAPVFARDVLDAGPQGLGLLLSAPAAGSVIGAVIVSLLPQVERPGRMMVAAVVAYGVCLALFGMSGSLVAALLALVGAGAADSVSVAMRHMVRLIATPDELRGRVSAAHSALAMGGPRLGEFQSGMTAALVGPRMAMVGGGIGVVLIALVLGKLVPSMTNYRIGEDGEGNVDAAAVTPAGATAGLPGGRPERVR